MNFKLTPRQRRLAAALNRAQPGASDEGSADKIYNVTTGDFACYAEFFEKNKLEEFLIEEKGTRILFRKHRLFAHDAPPQSAQQPAIRADEGAQETAAEGGIPAAQAGENAAKVLSPLNGTFYTKPGPDTAPFVNVGDTVGPETVLCLIEAMKIYNEIKAETAGRIIKVLAQNAEAVKEGQELFWIE